MSCLVCSKAPTVRSHLIPRAFAREVQTGKAHAVVRTPNDFTPTQSGIVERNILCASCDNELGKTERIAVEAFRKLRREARTARYGQHTLKDIRGDDILRFVSGTLWKYSLASKQHGRIELGPYQDLLRDVAFSLKQVPRSVDALLIRLKRCDDDDGVFAYRTPKPERREGVRGYRLLVGGVLIFAKIDWQRPSGSSFETASIRGKPDLPYFVLPAQPFEEFQLGAKWAHSGALSEYLDKQEGR